MTNKSGYLNLCLLTPEYLGVELLGFMLILCWHFGKLWNCFAQLSSISQPYQKCIRIPLSLQLGHNLFFFLKKTIVIIAGVKYRIVSLSFIFLMINEVEHLFICLLAIYISSLEKCLFKAIFKNWVVFLLLNCESYFLIFQIQGLFQKIFDL